MSEAKHTPGPCKYGDPLCPCQDGDLCHYEGKNPLNVPQAFVASILAERDRLKEENAALVEAVTVARECIAYCRRARPDPQTGEGVPGLHECEAMPHPPPDRLGDALIEKLTRLAGNLEAAEEAEAVTNTDIGQRTCDEAISEISILRARVKVLEGALQKARNQVVAFALDELPPHIAEEQVAYIDAALATKDTGEKP